MCIRDSYSIERGGCHGIIYRCSLRGGLGWVCIWTGMGGKGRTHPCFTTDFFSMVCVLGYHIVVMIFLFSCYLCEVIGFMWESFGNRRFPLWLWYSYLKIHDSFLPLLLNGRILLHHMVLIVFSMNLLFLESLYRSPQLSNSSYFCQGSILVHHFLNHRFLQLFLCILRSYPLP